jgi:hypothetical protein
VLDGKTRDGESFYSEEQDEEGELEMLEDDYAQNIIANMDEETKRRFENGELSDGELKEMGLY